MQIERLKVFVDVAEFMSFTKAAEHSYISQSAVSQQIAALEKELGVALLLRDRKGNVSLTPEGKVFYNGCVQMIQVYEKTMTQLQHIQQGSRDIIYVGVLSGADSNWLLEVTEKLEALGSKVQLRPGYDNFNGLRQGLMNGRYDVVVSIGYALEGLEGIRYETLLELEPMLVVSKNHRLAGRTSVRVEEIQDEHFVTLGRENGAESFLHWIHERQREGLKLRYLETVKTAESQRMLVEMNAAVAVLPLLPRFEKYDMTKCCAIRLEGTREKIRYVAACRTESDGKPMQQLIQLIKEVYQKKEEPSAAHPKTVLPEA